jgi:hypothetical protein
MTAGIRVRAIALAILMAAFATSVRAAPPTTTIHVDDDAAPGGDGSALFPFNNVPDALKAARVSLGPVIIEVAPGLYSVDHSLVIDHSMELRGSSVLVKGADGWPTGEVVSGSETRIVGTAQLGTDSLVAVGQPGGLPISGVTIDGFIFENITTSVEVFLTRVQDYSIHNNVFLAPALFGMHSVASSGVVEGNYFSGVGTGAIFSGGYPASPSNVTFQRNRAVKNALGGVLLNGASIGIPELGDETNAIIQGNDLSNNSENPNFSFGVRVFILRRDPGMPGDSQSEGNVHASITGNRIVGNAMGFAIDAGFPFRTDSTIKGPTCDPRVFSGSIDLTLSGNTVAGSTLTPALVTFTRNTAAITPSMLSQWQYLHGATFTISDPDHSLAGAQIDHPEVDPFLGPCPADAAHETLGNILRYNGILLPNGRNF